MTTGTTELVFADHVDRVTVEPGVLLATTSRDRAWPSSTENKCPIAVMSFRASVPPRMLPIVPATGAVSGALVAVDILEAWT